MREVRARFAALDAGMVDEAKARFGVTAPLGAPTSTGMVTLHCPPNTIHALAVYLRERGAEAVTVAPIEYVFTAGNPLWETLQARLG